jgi:hypothetical protein
MVFKKGSQSGDTAMLPAAPAFGLAAMLAYQPEPQGHTIETAVERILAHFE